MASPQILSEAVIEPDLPIIDAHHHLWYWPETMVAAMAGPDNPFSRVLRVNAHYLLEDYLGDAGGGHNIIGTVYAQGHHVMYRTNGPEHMKSLGEVEFATGVAAMAESGLFGSTRVANVIIGTADLLRGDAVEEVLLAHIAAAGGRYRGVRSDVAYDADPALAASGGAARPGIMGDPGFRAGMRKLRDLDLTYDLWPWEPQLGEALDLVRAFPDVSFILDHIGNPLGVGTYEQQRADRFPIWQKSMRLLAAQQNVCVKIGGLGMPLLGFSGFLTDPPRSSLELAEEWRPYVETCIEAFGANRCMFESNFPVDSGTANFIVLWNAFKRLAANASESEKAALFAGTARRIYRMTI